MAWLLACAPDAPDTDVVARACLEFELPSYTFEPVVPGTWVSHGLALVNTCDLPVQVRSATVGAPFGVDEFAAFEVPPTGRTELRVRFEPDVAGAWEDVLTVDTDLGPRRLAVAGVANGVALELSADEVDFGYTEPGCPIEQRVVVKNTGTEPVTVDAIEADNPEFVPLPVLPVTLAPGGETMLVVVYEPFDDGEDVATITLRAGRAVVGQLPVRGAGQGAQFRDDHFLLQSGGATELIVLVGDTGDSPELVAARAALPAALVAAAGRVAAVPSRTRVQFLQAGSGVALGPAVELDDPLAEARLRARLADLTPFEGPEAGLDGLDGFFAQARAGRWEDAWVGARGPVSVLAVSDASDASAISAELYLQRWQAGVVRNGLRRAGAIVGDVPAPACDGVAPGLGYHELAVRTRGVIASICDPDPTEAIGRFVLHAAGLETDLALTRPAVAGSIRVQLDDTPVSGWRYDAERGYVRFSLDTAPTAAGDLRVDYTIATCTPQQ